jgi:hypothetical protein
MLRKQASVVKGKYFEWERDEGSMHPATQAQKSREIQSELSPIGKLESRYNLQFIRSRGFKVA